MNNSISLTQQQKQEQTLSPQQRVSLEMLAAPLMELQVKLNTILEQNPMIELESPKLELPVGDVIYNANIQANQAAMNDTEEEERNFEALLSGDSWLDELPLLEGSGDFEANKHHDFLLNNVISTPSQQDYWLEELRFLDLTAPLRRGCQAVIGSLDKRGFLHSTDAEIAEIAGCTELEAAEAVKIVQGFEPPGIAARSLAESLLIQLAALKIKDNVIEEIVRSYLDLVANNQLPQLSKILNISLSELQEKLEIFKQLKLSPAGHIDMAAEQVIIPEFFVRRRGNSLIIHDNPEVVPQLRVSGDYDEILNNQATDPAARKFLQEKKTQAEQLIKSLSLRQTTLRRITEIIVSEQFKFFMNGPGNLKPLTMAQVADKLDLHETTVSRAAAGKYLGTPYGVWEYKSFFTGGYVSASGEGVAADGVKEKIREIIGEENPRKPLSDDKIAAVLKQHGLSVARRTVAKYREELNILPSHLRKEF